MVAKLVAEEGDLKGLNLTLEDGDIWVIGRDPDACQLVIQDPLVSRRHFIARRTPEGITVENLSSTTPIQVNDEDIGNQPRLLQQGDTVKVGNSLFRYYEDASAHILGEEELLQKSPVATPERSLIPDEKYEDSAEDTIFDEEENAPLAEINFGLVETGRWLMKVIGGPNNGAEFHMQSGYSYVLGTDPHSCDIVFHDTSVSRQHAKITVTAEDTLLIEDLKSRNGVLVGGSPLDGKQSLEPNVIVTLGTTSFVVYDREGEMQTIISPLLPSIVKVLQQEEKPRVEEVERPPQPEVAPTPLPEIHIPPKNGHHFGPLILLAVIIGLFVLAGMGASALFKAAPIEVTPQRNTTELIQQALQPFPAIRYTYQKATNGLLLIGHVATAGEKNQLLYNLQGLKLSIDDSGIIIDEYVWQEVNSILAKNPAWKGITIHSPKAGQFVLSGYLQTRKQAEQLSDYISLNFPYLDLLKRQVIVEEDVLNQINAWIQDTGLRNVTAKMSNGEISLSGNAPGDKLDSVNQLIAKVKDIPGVRIVNNYIRTQAPEMGIINLSDRYHVTGESRVGNKYTVVINGRILSEGDNLDGMEIKKITPDTVLLEKEGTKYRIDY